MASSAAFAFAAASAAAFSLSACSFASFSASAFALASSANFAFVAASSAAFVLANSSALAFAAASASALALASASALALASASALALAAASSAAFKQSPTFANCATGYSSPGIRAMASVYSFFAKGQSGTAKAASPDLFKPQNFLNNSSSASYILPTMFNPWSVPPSVSLNAFLSSINSTLIKS